MKLIMNLIESLSFAADCGELVALPCFLVGFFLASILVRRPGPAKKVSFCDAEVVSVGKLATAFDHGVAVDNRRASICSWATTRLDSEDEDSWSSELSEDEEDWDIADIDDIDDIDSVSDDDNVRHYQAASRSVLEHYGLFSAAPGTWSTSCMPCGKDSITVDSDASTDEAESCMSESTEVDERAAEGWRSLLDHYDLFGASWTPARQRGQLMEDSEDDLEEEDADSDVDSTDVHEAPTIFSGAKDKDLAYNLFEHYGLFSASPGTWVRVE